MGDEVEKIEIMLDIMTLNMISLVGLAKLALCDWLTNYILFNF